jgi:hypothetical protein
MKIYDKIYIYVSQLSYVSALPLLGCGFNT